MVVRSLNMVCFLVASRILIENLDVTTLEQRSMNDQTMKIATKSAKWELRHLG
jgi:hypothetical protein